MFTVCFHVAPRVTTTAAFCFFGALTLTYSIAMPQATSCPATLQLHGKAPMGDRSIKSHVRPLYCCHICTPSLHYLFQLTGHYLIWNESMMTKHLMEKMCSNSRKPLLVSVYMCVFPLFMLEYQVRVNTHRLSEGVSTRTS